MSMALNVIAMWRSGFAPQWHGSAVTSEPRSCFTPQASTWWRMIEFVIEGSAWRISIVSTLAADYRFCLPCYDDSYGTVTRQGFGENSGIYLYNVMILHDLHNMIRWGGGAGLIIVAFQDSKFFIVQWLIYIFATTCFYNDDRVNDWISQVLETQRSIAFASCSNLQQSYHIDSKELAKANTRGSESSSNENPLKDLSLESVSLGTGHIDGSDIRWCQFYDDEINDREKEQ